MQLQQETGNKQGVLAIRSFEKEVSESLSNLFITEYRDVNVFSVYSDLTKNLLAYKVLSKSALNEDSWMNSGFNKKLRVDFNPSFTFVPGRFARDGAESEIEVELDGKNDRLHYSVGLLKYHSNRREDAVYLYRTGDFFSIFAFIGGKCVFANSFSCENETEVLYFILNSLDINSMKQETTVLHMDYSLQESRMSLDFFRPYFSSVEVLKLDHPEIDNRIPWLHEMLFANQLMSLCV